MITNSKANGFRINLKQKLYIGFGFFFLMVILLGGFGIYFIYNVANRSSAMLKENYQTIESTTALLARIDELKSKQSKFFLGHETQFDTASYQADLEVISQLLKAISNNITEIGEGELVAGLNQAYLEYIEVFNLCLESNHFSSNHFFNELQPKYQKTRELISTITQLNLAAINHKNSLLRNTSQKAFFIISIIGIVCFAVSLLFFLRYPNKIVNPIRQMIAAINEIAQKNYEKRLIISSNDELQQLADEFNIMASRLDEYEHSNLSKLVFEKKRIDTIINKMQDAIIGLSETGEIIFCNSLACKLLRTSNENLVGKQVFEVILHNPQLALIMSGSELGETFKADVVPLKLYVDDKAWFFTKEVIDIEINRSQLEPPIKVGNVIVLKNVTLFLEQAEAKTNFIATISHELKTPIAALKLNLKLLEDQRIGQLNEEQRQIVGNIISVAEKMKNISSELLDMAQIESGTIKLNIQKVWTEQIVEYTTETLKNQQLQNSRLFIDIEPNLPMLFCDPEKTAWVLINLISNALKYTDESKSINVVIAREDQTVRFTVQDFGQGISQNYIDKIFDKFFRIPGSGEEGRGLGLSISKEFITKQNGKIWAESEIGFGSRFNFTLPVANI